MTHVLLKRQLFAAQLRTHWNLCTVGEMRRAMDPASVCLPRPGLEHYRLSCSQRTCQGICVLFTTEVIHCHCGKSRKYGQGKGQASQNSTSKTLVSFPSISPWKIRSPHRWTPILQLSGHCSRSFLKTHGASFYSRRTCRKAPPPRVEAACPQDHLHPPLAPPHSELCVQFTSSPTYFPREVQASHGQKCPVALPGCQPFPSFSWPRTGDNLSR